jgi:hypothetical protein
MNIKRQSLVVQLLTSKRVRRSVIGTVSVLVLLVGGGLAYTWWMGRHAKVAPAVESATIKQDKPFLEPTTPDPKANVGVGIQVLTSPLAPGSNASISIHTYPKATCTIKVTYNEVAAADTGLRDKTADEYGLATWSWSVPADTPLGTWPVWVICSHHGLTGQVRGDLVVAEPTSEN